MQRVRLKEDEGRSNGRFAKGNSLGGRKPGSTNKTTGLLKDAIILAAENVGDPRKGGEGKLVGYLEWLAKVEPKSFAALLGRVLPYHIVGKVEHEHRQYKTKEELIEELKARGLPVENIFELLAKHSPKFIEAKANEPEDDDEEDEE